MSTVLIVYGATHGQTHRVADHIAKVLVDAGHQADVFDVETIDPSVDPAVYDGVVVGGRTEMGTYPTALVDWVRANRDRLAVLPSAFFSISTRTSRRTPGNELAAQASIAEFVRATGWEPGHRAALGGALAYTQYNGLIRFVMKRIARERGDPVDPSVDYELTDWYAVDRFVQELEADLSSSATEAVA